MSLEVPTQQYIPPQQIIFLRLLKWPIDRVRAAFRGRGRGARGRYDTLSGSVLEVPAVIVNYVVSATANLKLLC